MNFTLLPEDPSWEIIEISKEKPPEKSEFFICKITAEYQERVESWNIQTSYLTINKEIYIGRINQFPEGEYITIEVVIYQNSDYIRKCLSQTFQKIKFKINETLNQVCQKLRIEE